MTSTTFHVATLSLHSVRDVSFPQAALQRSRVAWLTDELGEGLFVRPCQDVAFASHAPEVCTIQLQMVHAALLTSLGGHQSMNHLHPGLLGLRELGCFFAGLLSSFFKLNQETLAVVAKFAMPTSNAASKGLPCMPVG